MLGLKEDVENDMWEYCWISRADGRGERNVSVRTVHAHSNAKYSILYP